MDRVGYCIVGAGFISVYHAAGVLSDPGAELIGFADSNRKAAEEKKASFKARKASDDLGDFLSDPEVTACIVCVPPSFNVDIIKQCAKAGKHILCEKPLARSLEECDEIIEACRKADVVLAVGHSQLFYRPNVKAKQLLTERAIGRTTFLRTTLATRTGRSDRLGWRGKPDLVGGGVLSDPGLHRLYMIRDFFGDPVSVRAVIDKKIYPDNPGEDFVISIFDFKDGRTATLEICGGTSVWDVRTEIYGTEGIMVINGGDMFVNGPGSSSRLLEIYKPDKQMSIPISEAGADGRESFVDQVKDFTQCLLGKRAPRASGEDGKVAVKLAKAVYESAANDGAPIRL